MQFHDTQRGPLPGFQQSFYKFKKNFQLDKFYMRFYILCFINLEKKMCKKFVGFFLCLSILSFPLSAMAENTHVIRAAIEIGMGGPKLQVAEVNPKTNKIVKMLHTQRYFVNFYDSLSDKPDKQLCPEIMKDGLKAFKEAIDKANSFKVDGIVAIATASFRSAQNGDQFAMDLQDETGIKVHIVDQHLEGILTFQAALSRLDVDAEHLVVWDIGGGSIQFIGTAPDGSFLVDCGEVGVGHFKDFIIENIQQRNINEAKSPNPMSAEDIVQAEAHARNLSKGLSQVFRDKISHPHTVVVGAGSVFGFGIHGMVKGKNPFFIKDLSDVALSLPGKTDADLGGGDFAFVEGANVVLTLGFMKGLKIEEMRTINANNADGAIIYAPFWE